MKQIEAFLAAAQTYAARELRPQAGRFETEAHIPKEVLRDMAQQRFFGAAIAEEFGGMGLTEVDYGRFTETIGKACNSVRELITVHTSLVGASIQRWGTSDQKRYWLPRMATGETLAAFALTEPDAGSDIRGVRTSYEKNGDGFVISGRKKWISFADIADLFLVIASCQEEVTAFLIDRNQPGVSTKKMTGLLASNSSHLAEITLDQVEVPACRVLGRIGGGLAYIVNTALDHGRYSIAWAGVAIAQEALEHMVTYARTRTQGGRPICDYEAIQAIIADAYAQLQAARALCVSAGQLRMERHPDAMIQTTAAKYVASKMAMKVTTDAVQVFGGNGFSKEYSVERLFREAKVLEIIEGTSQVLQPLMAHHALRAFYQHGGVHSDNLSAAR